MSVGPSGSKAPHSASGSSPPTWRFRPTPCAWRLKAAIAAYEHVVDEKWKPFERAVENPGQTVGRKATELQMSTLG
ncbi:hypothetical protein BG36_15995 [Aquamicrobium defluvii]|jgi:hypothetical protein|uniref:Uncharacterized protein n=1 Tax=Aquamicrobium defluvii TaxID=69279 RepID=A0A011U8F7_9HYPH|nr:hypothetical protein BG36_15995 [Aquamicrobium defluvii]EZQ12954.1 hypothetical protein CF98_30725 [Halopseudomonas bauzanensis]